MYLRVCICTYSTRYVYSTCLRRKLVSSFSQFLYSSTVLAGSFWLKTNHISTKLVTALGFFLKCSLVARFFVHNIPAFLANRKMKLSQISWNNNETDN